MAHFDFKIVVAGPFAAGKTTLIRAASDSPLVGTEAPTSGDEASVKATTTVGMEYGTLRVGGGNLTAELRLFGVPGQERFSFMWDIVASGMDGFFVLVDAQRPETWPESAKVAETFARLATVPTVVGINHRGDAIEPELLERITASVPVAHGRYVPFNVTKETDARDALVELLLEILEFDNHQGVAA